MVKSIIEFKVELGETDSAGLVYYPNYFHWCDRATRKLLDVTGLSPRELLGRYHFDQPVIDCSCRFYAPLRYDDPVKIVATVTEVLDKTFRVDHQIFSGDILVASGYEVRAWVEIDNPFQEGRLEAINIPGFFAERLKIGEQKPSYVEDTLSTIPEPALATLLFDQN